MSRPPGWLIGIAVVGLPALMAVPWVGGTPEPRSTVGQPLAPASLFDPAIWVATPPPGPGAGTAFSVDARGVWLTARHVVEGCARTAIVTAPGHGVAAKVVITPGRETAVLLTQGGAPALPIAPPEVLRRGQMGYEPGFPGARPGEAASELRRRANLVVGWRGLRAQPVLMFIETSRWPQVRGSLAGLSGAPVLDAHGRVLGVTVAENPRRRRLYATTPASLHAALARARLADQAVAGEAVTPQTWRAVSDALRERLSVAEVECLAR